MAKARTPWSKRAVHTMTDKEISTTDISKGVNLARQYVAAVVYGRINSPKARKKISAFLGISDSEDDE